MTLAERHQGSRHAFKTVKFLIGEGDASQLPRLDQVKDGVPDGVAGFGFEFCVLLIESASDLQFERTDEMIAYSPVQSY